MAKGRYFFGILVGVAGIVGGIIWAIYYGGFDIECLFYAYAVASVLANLIWFDGPVIVVGKMGFGLCATVFSFFFGTGIGCLLLLCAPIAITICAGVVTLTIVAVGVVSLIMYPINIVRFASDLY